MAKRSQLTLKHLPLKETDIQRQIRDYLRAAGWYVIRNQQNMGSHAGLSDLTAIRRGRVLWIEVKTQKGTQSDAQIEFQQAIEAHGGEYVLARCLEDVWEAIGPEAKEAR